MGKIFAAVGCFVWGILSFVLGAMLQWANQMQPIEGSTWAWNLFCTILMLAGLLVASVIPAILVKEYCDGK